jgi:hypothetical protein
VQIDQRRRPLRQRSRRRQPTVDVRTGSPFPGHDPAEDDLLVTRQEPPLDRRLRRTRPHERRIGAPAEQQLDRLHDERLAGAGLAGDGRHARPDHDVEVGDHPQVAHGQLDQHGRRTCRCRPARPHGVSEANE